MPKKAPELSALAVKRMTVPGLHAVGGIAGLYLAVVHEQSRSWVLRVVVAGKRRHIGLGGYPDVSLAQARDKARIARDQISRGIDPIEHRRSLVSELRASQANAINFEQAATAYIDANSVAWRNAKHRAQWSSSLETYAYPHIGHLLVRDVMQEHILAILEPIWKTKTETASRVRGRIETILDWASVRGYRSADNPARWRGHLDKLLPAPAKVQKVKHHAALAIDDMPAFMQQLRHKQGTSARALEFLVLTATRSGEVRGAPEFDTNRSARVWTIPGERMKAGREHRVPLSNAAMKLLNSLPQVNSTSLVFPALNGEMMSDMAMSQLMRRMKSDAVPHGFRSTFRDWAGERTNYPRELAEDALAHTLTNKVEAAYRRGDALERRRAMMQEWAVFCGVGEDRPGTRSATSDH